MKKLLLTLSLLLSAAVPAYGSHAVPTVEQLTREVEALAPGTDVILVTPETLEFNAFFIPGGEAMCLGPVVFGICFGEVFVTKRDTVFFVVGTYPGLDLDALSVIARHEAAHALQHRAGRPFDEWEADLVAADTLCAEGRDGLGLTLRVLGMLLPSPISRAAIFGGKHGHPYERMAHVQRNSRCRGGAQAP
jgi:hypothetical protein